MATLLPLLSEEKLGSLPAKKQSEVKVYRACTKLADNFAVLYSVAWIARTPGGDARDGEADFVICSPTHGLLVLEVKGGGVRFDPGSGEWISTDRRGARHVIKDPFRQAAAGKYSILSKLHEHPRWKSAGIGKFCLGHAVFFPDPGDASTVVRPDGPIEIVGCSRDLDRFPKWIESVFAYWARQSGESQLGRHGVDLLRQVFARPLQVSPLLAHRLAEEERQRVQLTDQQAMLLQFLGSRRRAAISGGAGTGKTILAVEKAKRLAAEGFSTLLTCYNRPLADHLANVCDGYDRLVVMSFHQLCFQWIRNAGKNSGRDLLKEARKTYPRADEYDVLYPMALAEATSILQDRYDAIVCDEGQDFREEYWFPIELLLSDSAASPLYVFYDDNQNIYTRASTFPITDAPFPLSRNCRNTKAIHDSAYRFYAGDPITSSEITGVQVESIVAAHTVTQAQKIHGRIVELLDKEGLAPWDICVLVSDAQNKSTYYGLLRHKPLPRGAKWVEEGAPQASHVRLETVNRFKGLESTVVFLWGIDNIDPATNRELLYVGLSRAKSLLFVIGQAECCKKVANDVVEL